MTHTPGKWIVHGPSEDLEYSEGGDYAILADNQCLIADVIHMHGLGDAADNARLIAAAPEMLEALKDVKDAIKTLPADALGEGDWTEPSGEPIKYSIRDELFYRIGEVIAKAEGNREPA